MDLPHLVWFMLKRGKNPMTKRLNRIPLELARCITNSEYVALDYILFRTNLKGFKIITTDIAKKTGMDIKTVFKVLKSFRQHGFVTQDEWKHNHFNYQKWYKWVETTTNGSESQKDTKVGSDPIPNVVVGSTQKWDTTHSKQNNTKVPCTIKPSGGSDSPKTTTEEMVKAKSDWVKQMNTSSLKEEFNKIFGGTL